MVASKFSVADMQVRKDEGVKFTMLSIYDYPTALIADRAGLDSILVGDSLAMTVLGHADTISVTMDEMLHHVKAVARAAGRFMKEGRADAV